MMIDHVADQCVGCGACQQKCPQKCISMEQNEEGFLYPVIDTALCIRCNVCEKVCPACVCETGEGKQAGRYGVVGVKISGEDPDVMNSASAGVFFQLASAVIAAGGVAYGAVFNELHEVEHIRGTTMGDVRRMQNSKYVQSNIKGIYRDVEEQLNVFPEKAVIFSGTPCQCAGLREYLGKDYQNLFCVDFICHGVPSPLALKKYLSWLSSKYDERIEDYQFRSKKKGWNYKGRMCSIVKFNEHYWPVVFDPYMASFLKADTYRDVCYQCRYNANYNVADITLGDFAGVRENQPNFFDKRGCSVVLLNSEKGLQLIKLIQEKFSVMALRIDEVCHNNPNLLRPWKRTARRDEIYVGITSMSESDYVTKCLKKSISARDIVSYYIPYRVKVKLRVLKGKN